ncbi:DEAD/DEAH box helicase [Methanobacterium alcaliphilum]|uniref:DEAD/DEAH box helicase n=1 Tax=Methanobacterium alcaliphilum TaxID=392018 RepID=UPI00200A7067|nr:DEAD/DEAH box helicase [Methanobacterium alcaliphilum]MCK9151133.1 DEAD/DEAH box helicase [Methanobacterium alcaliphilum]
MEKYISHPLIQPNKVEARLYQQLLAADVLKKGNTMIVAPTALGKTIVAALVGADRLYRYKGSKIVIVAPSKPLVIQHEESFREFLTLTSTTLTGAIKGEERLKRWEDSQIICATPQTIESDLIKGIYDFKDVSLLVFDECHRGVGSYSYVYLASRYLQESQDPLILGLTASPGSDKEKIKCVCENLFIQEVIIKSEDDPDVSPYFNPIEIEWVSVELGEDLKRIKDHLNKALKHRLKMLKNMDILPTISVSKKDLLQARSKVQNRIARSTNPPKECYKAISIIAASINVQHALELLETQGINTLQQYFLRLKKKNTKAAKGLIMDADFAPAMILTRKAYQMGVEHPKLDKLIKILNNEMEKESSKIIVFTQFRDTLENIYQRCQKENINAVKFFGQGKRNGEKGLTQKQQKDIIKGFRMGNYDVLLSTSVAEEGIDIPAVDLVVLYEPVPSEIRMIQRRGRTGRKQSGRMMVLIAKGTRDEGYYWSSVHKERRMKEELGKSSPLKNLEIKPINLDNIKSRAPVKENTSVLEEEIINEKEFSSSEDKPVVYADSREVNSRVLRELTQLGVEVVVKPLAVADYQVSDDVALERKTASDFVSSIADKRLHKQVKEMVEEFNKPLMILEGDNLYSGFMNPNAIRGALASVAVDFRIPILPTRSPEDTAAMIRRIAIREQTHNKPEIQVRTEKKPLTLWEQQLFIVESLPNVGPVNARKLLEEFGSVKEIINASQEDLQRVDGIGKKIARNINKVVEIGFKKIKKEKDQKLID